MHRSVLPATRNTSKPRVKKTAISASIAVLLTVLSNGAIANSPTPLTNSQLDTVSAGAVSVQVQALANGNNSVASVTLKSTANTSGDYTLATAIGVGQAYACCNGGKTNVRVDRNGAALKNGGGTVTATIKILNRGSYSFGIGAQIGLSAN
jgi:hypothetical protein